jgi:hypothetical protein
MIGNICGGIGAFAGMSVLMVITGLYGVPSQITGYRKREFGIRLALGATPAGIGWMVLRQTLLFDHALTKRRHGNLLCEWVLRSPGSVGIVFANGDQRKTGRSNRQDAKPRRRKKTWRAATIPQSGWES